jgi:hypothetical protein
VNHAPQLKTEVLDEIGLIIKLFQLPVDAPQPGLQSRSGTGKRLERNDANGPIQANVRFATLL